jgi:hypothetical protein
MPTMKLKRKKNGYQSSAKTIPNFKMNKALAYIALSGRLNQKF